MDIRLTPTPGPIVADIHLPGSKSESNRALILQALSRGLVQVQNLSTADDTTTLERLLRESPDTMDVGHAGTAMRFLAAYLAFRPSDHVLTGSARMNTRPMGPLVDALRKMGAEIHCLEQEGHAPLLICGRNAKFGDSTVTLPGHVSSQFISALLLIAHAQPDGLRIVHTGEVTSRPYIEMTLALLARFGVTHTWQGNVIYVARQPLRAGNYAVEADWSAASYWFCLAALAPVQQLRLHGLRRDSLQGDSVVADKMAALGVLAEWQDDVLVVQGGGEVARAVTWDFVDCPDLAQGLLVAAAALGVAVRATGLHTLRVKETDRIAALQAELGKFGVGLMEEDDVWKLTGTWAPQAARIETYLDHRMAMAFAPLAVRCPGLVIADAAVVGKSYPTFWEDMAKAGIISVPMQT